VPQLQVGLVGFALLAGLVVVISPCGVGLLPAYLGLLIEDGVKAAPGRRVARAAAGGTVAAAAIVALYAVLAAIAWAAGDALRASLPWLGPVLGLALFAFGTAAFFGADWTALGRRLGLGKVDARRGFAAFGAAYGLAGFACTGPVFLPVLVAGFALGAATGLAVFVAYTAAVAGVIVAAALLVAAGEAPLLRRMLGKSVQVHRVSAVVLALGGLYLAWYAAHAYGLLG
jgi:cytochrome c biogenesis protein CcdA